MVDIFDNIAVYNWEIGFLYKVVNICVIKIWNKSKQLESYMIENLVCNLALRVEKVSKSVSQSAIILDNARSVLLVRK